MRGSNSFYLFTSISPLLGGDELEYQKSCIGSWRSAGFEVATVNGRSEAAQIAALELDIQILNVAQNGKPRVRDILACIVAKNCRYAGIINADCALLPYPAVSDHLRDYLDGRLVLAERVDVDGQSMPRSDSCGGFDAFFFDATTLPSDFDDSFGIGVPWWDYCLPLAVAAEGGRIANLTTPLLLHRIHSPGWTGTERQHVGQAFWRFLKKWRFSKPNDFPALGQEVDILWANETLTLEQLGTVGSACFQWLRTRQLENDLRFLPPRMEPIETLLRSMPMTLKKSAEIAEIARYLRKQVEDCTAEVVGLRAEVAGLRLEGAGLRAKVSNLKANLMAMEQSTSWLITKPLRQITSILRRSVGTRS